MSAWKLRSFCFTSMETSVCAQAPRLQSIVHTQMENSGLAPHICPYVWMMEFFANT